MAQIFHPSFNTISRLSIFGGVFLGFGLLWLLNFINRTDYVTQVHVVRPQPVPFSHEHHVNGLGIDCRFCHWPVELGPFAGIPATQVCMNCHSEIWKDSPTLEPVRESYRTGMPLRWTRVHDLPDYAYFDHSIHVRKGVGCSSCHGRVDQMPLTFKVASLDMGWCLDCHRHPEEFIRPRDRVFDMDWSPPDDQEARGRSLVYDYAIQVEQLTDCSLCHR